jgi:hypothetical protein
VSAHSGSPFPDINEISIMNKSIVFIAALIAGSVTLPAHAGLLLSVSAAAQTVSLGDQVSIDLLFSGLEEGLGWHPSGVGLSQQ